MLAVWVPQAFETPTVYKPVALTTSEFVLVEPPVHTKLVKLLLAVNVALTPLHNKVDVDAKLNVGVGITDTETDFVSLPQRLVYDTETVPPVVVTTDPVDALFDHVYGPAEPPVIVKVAD